MYNHYGLSNHCPNIIQILCTKTALFRTWWSDGSIVVPIPSPRFTEPGGWDTWGPRNLQHSPGLRAAAGQEVRVFELVELVGRVVDDGWCDAWRFIPKSFKSWKEHDLVLKPVVTSGTSIFFETSKWLTTTRTKWIKPVGGWSWIHFFRDEYIYIHISTTGKCAFRNISAGLMGWIWMDEHTPKKTCFDPGAYDDETWGLGGVV